jgi:hypothetical protein
MTAPPKKNRKQVRVYIDDDDAPLLAEVQKLFGKVTETDVVTALVSASLRAVKENNYRITLPLRLHLFGAESAHRLNEPAPARPR